MNMANLLDELGGGENFQINLKNEVIKGLCCVHEGGEPLTQGTACSRERTPATRCRDSVEGA